MRRRDERGASMPIVAVLSLVLVLIAAFAVDLGMQRSTRRDMQALADVVALDLARLLDGRSAADIKSGSGGKPTLATAKSASFARNNDSLIGDAPSGCVDGACIEAYLVDVDAQGNYPEQNGLPQQVADTAVPDGVVVVASTKVGFAFSGLVGVESGSSSRRALGVAMSASCIQFGSYVASLSPASSALFGDILKPLLGASTLQMVGYNGLASANISLLDLVKAPSIGVGTVNELVTAPSITAGEMFLAAAHVLASQGKIAEAAVFTAASTSVVAPIVLDMGKFLLVDSSTPDAVLQTELNALDLLIGTVFLANGENFLDVANLQASLASVGNVSNTELKIIESPRRYCAGEEDAQTSQVSFKSTITVNPSNSPLVNTARTLLRLVNPLTGTPDATVVLDLNAQVAGAHGHLTNTSCDPDVFDFDIWTDLATMSLTGQVTVKGDISATVLGLANTQIPVQFGVTVSSSTFKPAGTAPVHGQLSIPPQTYADHVEVGPGDLILPSVSFTVTPGTLVVGPLTVSILGIPIVVPTADLLALVNPVITALLSPTGALVDRIEPLVTPIVNKINGILVQLNEALGMNLGGADVYGLPTPLCGEPRLSG
jgi:uncharacterized membrane protein